MIGKALQIQAKEVIKEQVVPAYQTLDFFFRTEYLPMSRDTYGVSALPNGYEWYENLAAYHTTTDLSPDEIHNIGLSEVKRIRSEMQEVIDSIGFEGTF